MQFGARRALERCLGLEYGGAGRVLGFEAIVLVGDMVRLGVGAALAPCCCSAAPASSFFLRQARPVALASRSSVFLSSQLRLRLRLRRCFSNPGGRRVLTQLVRAAAREEEQEQEQKQEKGEAGEEAVEAGNEEELEDEPREEGKTVFLPRFAFAYDDVEEPKVGLMARLKEKFRRKSKEELEAEAEEKSAEVLEVCVTLRSHC